MFPNEIIYQIAILVSPSALIKLSLCSKAIRSFILNDDYIWRVQYFRQWPCAFTFGKSDSEYNLFPAATWLKSFILRKLAEENLRNNSSEEIQSNFTYEDNYSFFVNDLIFSITRGALDIFIGLKPSVELTQFLSSRVGNYSLRKYAMVGWDSNFVIAFNDSLLIYSKKVQKEVGIGGIGGIKELIPVDSDIFLAEKQSDYYLYKIDEEITEELFAKGCRVCKIYGVQSRIISVDKSRASRFSWKCWNIGNNEQEVVYQSQVLSKESKGNLRLGHFIADTDFLFISYYKIGDSGEECSIYVYSFSSKKHKIFKINQTYYKKEVAIFYASRWNNIQANYYLDKKDVLLTLFSGSSTLESLTLKTVDVSNIGFICITQLTRRLLLASSYYVVNQAYRLNNTYSHIMSIGSFRTEDTMFDLETGEILWRKKYIFPYQIYRGLSSICSRFYCTFPGKIMDYKSNEDPEIGEWLHSLFVNN